MVTQRELFPGVPDTIEVGSGLVVEMLDLDPDPDSDSTTLRFAIKDPTGMKSPTFLFEQPQRSGARLVTGSFDVFACGRDEGIEKGKGRNLAFLTFKAPSRASYPGGPWVDIAPQGRKAIEGLLRPFSPLPRQGFPSGGLTKAGQQDYKRSERPLAHLTTAALGRHETLLRLFKYSKRRGESQGRGQGPSRDLAAR